METEIRDMNRAQSATTHRETTYKDNVGNVDIAGANIYRPWWLNTHSRPPWTVEVQIMHISMDGR